MSEDLKPRGEKPQWWLAVRPSTLAEVLTPRGGAPPALLADLDTYQALLVHSTETSEQPPGGTPQSGDYAWVRRTTGLARSLFRVAVISDTARVFEHGAQKYLPGNFRRAFDDPEGMRREYFSAIMRHLIAFWLGETLDPESGLPHTAHALCGALMLLEMEMEQ